MKYYVKENIWGMEHRGFFVSQEPKCHMQLLASSPNWISIFNAGPNWKNHKTAREAIGHLFKVSGPNLKRIMKTKNEGGMFPIRYVYSDK